MTAEEYFAEKNGGKTASESLADNELISPVWTTILMEEYASQQCQKLQKRVDFLVKAGDTLLLDNKELQQQCQKRDKLIKTYELFIEYLLQYSDITSIRINKYVEKIEQLKKELK